MKRKAQNRKVSTRPILYRMNRSVLDWMKLSGFFLLSLIVVVSTYVFLNTTDSFNVKSVEISGELNHTLKEDILKVASIPFGKNLFSINLEKIGKRIQLLPWVYQYQVRRWFPSQIQIHIVEHEPLAILKINNHQTGDYYLMSQKGIIFKRIKNLKEYDLPLISGFDHQKLEEHPTYYGVQIREVYEFLNQVQSITKVSTIHYDSLSGIEMILNSDNGESKIFFGKQPYENKIKKWKIFAEKMKNENIFFKEINLNSENKIIARK